MSWFQKFRLGWDYIGNFGNWNHLMNEPKNYDLDVPKKIKDIAKKINLNYFPESVVNINYFDSDSKGTYNVKKRYKGKTGGIYKIVVNKSEPLEIDIEYYVDINSPHLYKLRLHKHDHHRHDLFVSRSQK